MMKRDKRSAEQGQSIILVAAAFPDVYRGGGCSTLAATAPATKGGKPLLARNLDFFPLGILDRYGLIALYRPDGMHAFASVTWPGLCGVLSGMNDAGLALAVHEVLAGRDGSRLFNPKGVPYTFALRRVLDTPDAAQQWARGDDVFDGCLR